MVFVHVRGMAVPSCKSQDRWKHGMLLTEVLLLKYDLSSEGLTNFPLFEKRCRVENHLDSTKTVKSELGTSNSIMAALLNFLSNLTFTTEHFSLSFAVDSIYAFHLFFRVSLRPNRCSW